MFRLSQFNIVEILIRAVVVLLAISVHETAHGYAAYKLGDPTAKSMGRLSLNPLKHIDPIGALCMLLFGFGWAKPVMINPYYFKKPKRDTAITGLAGPVSNFIMAFISILILQLLFRFHIPLNAFTRIIQIFLIQFTLLNIGLGVFNLIPIPPLDGSKVFLSLLPNRLYNDIMRYEQFGWIVLVVALGLGVLDPILGTVRNWIVAAMQFLVSWI